MSKTVRSFLPKMTNDRGLCENCTNNFSQPPYLNPQQKNQTSLLVKFYTYAIPALLARIWYTNLTLSRQRHRHSFHFYFSILPKNDFLAILIRLVVLEHSICVELWLAENGPRVMYAELNQSE